MNIHKNIQFARTDKSLQMSRDEIQRFDIVEMKIKIAILETTIPVIRNRTIREISSRLVQSSQSPIEFALLAYTGNRAPVRKSSTPLTPLPQSVHCESACPGPVTLQINQSHTHSKQVTLICNTHLCDTERKLAITNSRTNTHIHAHAHNHTQTHIHSYAHRLATTHACSLSHTFKYTHKHYCIMQRTGFSTKYTIYNNT